MGARCCEGGLDGFLLLLSLTLYGDKISYVDEQRERGFYFVLCFILANK